MQSKNGLTDRLAVLVVDSGGSKEAQVQLYSPGGANVCKFNRICRRGGTINHSPGGANVPDDTLP